MPAILHNSGVRPFFALVRELAASRGKPEQPDSGRSLLLSLFMGGNRLYANWWCLNTTNRCTLPARGPAILIANHTSPLDPPLLQSSTDRPIGFLMARELFEVRWFEWLYRLLGCIPVNRTGRDTSALKASLRKLSQGEVLGIFPEGRMNLSGGSLLEPQLGAALLALRSRAPVIPVYIAGAPIGYSLVKPFFQRCRTQVRYGKPLDLTAYYGQERNRKVLEEVGRLMMSNLAELADFEQPRNASDSDQDGAAA